MTHLCNWPGCLKRVRSNLWGCRRHWYMLPENIRVRIWKTSANPPSAEYVQAAQDTQEWIKSNGQQHGATTQLQESILLWLRSDGPLSDLSLFSRLTDFETGGLGATVVTTCLELEKQGFIEPPSNDPHIWQLSDKGLEYVAKNLTGVNVNG